MIQNCDEDLVLFCFGIFQPVIRPASQINACCCGSPFVKECGKTGVMNTQRVSYRSRDGGGRGATVFDHLSLG